MPVFWDFLLTPWRVLEVVSTQAPAPPPGALSRALCSLETVGDQSLSVCHVLGYTMPSFIFFASCGILAIFAFSSVTLWLQCRSLAASLDRMTTELRKLPQSAAWATQTDVQAISSAMDREPSLRTHWQDFTETLLHAPSNGEVFTTRAISDALPQGDLMEQNVHVSFFATIPGILTGIGLLMTFVAILDGLAHVSVDAAMDVKGIGGLINGLSGKFVSSVTAVSCAVAFVLVERYALAAPAHSYRAFVRALGKRFRRKTTEHLLYEIQCELASRSPANAAPASPPAQARS